jgi:hypothetical protein
VAGLYGEIDSRADFFSALARAKVDVVKLRARLPSDETLLSVQRQLDAITAWTANGRAPTLEDREKISMGIRMDREFEVTNDIEIYDFRELIGDINNYMDDWPDDSVAADPDNDDDL